MSKKNKRTNETVKDYLYKKLKKKYAGHYDFMEHSYAAEVIRKDLGPYGYSFAVQYKGVTYSAGINDDDTITDEELIKKAKYSCMNWLLQQCSATKGNYISYSAE